MSIEGLLLIRGVKSQLRPIGHELLLIYVTLELTCGRVNIKWTQFNLDKPVDCAVTVPDRRTDISRSVPLCLP